MARTEPGQAARPYPRRGGWGGIRGLSLLFPARIEIGDIPALVALHGRHPHPSSPRCPGPPPPCLPVHWLGTERDRGVPPVPLPSLEPEVSDPTPASNPARGAARRRAKSIQSWSSWRVGRRSISRTMILWKGPGRTSRQSSEPAADPVRAKAALPSKGITRILRPRVSTPGRPGLAWQPRNTRASACRGRIRPPVSAR